MRRNRKHTVRCLLRGLLVSILVTLAAMLALSALLLMLPIPDSLLHLLNQLVKLAAAVLGSCAAVPRGSERGLVTGLTVSCAYIILGYVSILLLGGGSFSVAGMLGEILLAGAAGSVTGALRANLAPRQKRTHV